MISLAFGTVVVATVYALGHIGGNHINPAVTLGLAVVRQVPLDARCPAYIGAQVVGAIVGAAAIIGVLGKKASDVGLGVASYGDISWAQAFTAEFVGTFILVFTIFGVIHRKAAPGSPASRSAWSCSRRSSRSRPPPAPPSTRPAPSARCSSSRSPAATVKWDQLPVYLAAELLAGVVAALLYGVLARTPADRDTAGPGIDLGDPEPEPTPQPAPPDASRTHTDRKGLS